MKLITVQIENCEECPHYEPQIKIEDMPQSGICEELDAEVGADGVSYKCHYPDA